MQIAVAGLGAIGSALGLHLVKAGHEVLVWNRSPGPAARLAGEGARPVATVADAFQADIVITLLFDDEAVRERLLDETVLGAARRGILHICMSTISPELADELDDACKKHGIRYVSAPLFGRPDAAAKAQLNMVVAGEPDAVREAQEILRLFGQTWPMGDRPRVASLAKIAGNFMIGCAIEAMSESAAVLAANGADGAAFLDMMSKTLFSAPLYRAYAASVADVSPLTGGLSLPLKDMTFALRAGDQSGLDLAFARVLVERLTAARDTGLAGADWSTALGRMAKRPLSATRSAPAAGTLRP